MSLQVFAELLRARLALLDRSVDHLVEEMARARAPVHRQSVYQWLRGGPIKEKNFRALVEVLDVPLDERRAWGDAAGFGDVLEAVYPGDDRRAS